MLIDSTIWTLARASVRASDGARVELHRARGGARLLIIGEGREHYYPAGKASDAGARFDREVGQ